jgi:hypothetical protein
VYKSLAACCCSGIHCQRWSSYGIITAYYATMKFNSAFTRGYTQKYAAQCNYNYWMLEQLLTRLQVWAPDYILWVRFCFILHSPFKKILNVAFGTQSQGRWSLIYRDITSYYYNYGLHRSVDIISSTKRRFLANRQGHTSPYFSSIITMIHSCTI